MSNISSTSAPPAFLKLLAHDLRWNVLVHLAHSDYRVQELVERVQRPMNLVSYHLAQLRRSNLVAERRSSEDGRDIYYMLDLDFIQSQLQNAAGSLHPALIPPAIASQRKMATESAMVKVLFLCTHNSARSQMAEALLRAQGGPQIEVFSAGTTVSGVHPLAADAMAAFGLDIRRQRSKHLDEFREHTFACIVTVCDRVREQCPIFPDDPPAIHWSIADPAAVEGDLETQRQAFFETARQIDRRVRHLLPVLRQLPNAPRTEPEPANKEAI